MRVLFITSPVEDYLSDSIFHGLRSLLGSDVVDYPKSEVMYEGFRNETGRSLYGRGFSLYTGLLQDIAVDRFDIEQKIQRNHFQVIVFGNIWSQFGLVNQWFSSLMNKKVAILDGADSPDVYPFSGKWMRSAWSIFNQQIHKKFKYFKREWTNESQFGYLNWLLAKAMSASLKPSKHLFRTAFSFPEEKIVTNSTMKLKNFPKHIVDAELASIIPGSSSKYAFANETEYYLDLQSSKFGVTTKRAGWDCMRHYEIAANRAVPCFKMLKTKPLTCAPHGLNELNCISYQKADELTERISSISNDEYEQLQTNSLNWARANSTKVRARQLLDHYCPE